METLNIDWILENNFLKMYVLKKSADYKIMHN